MTQDTITQAIHPSTTDSNTANTTNTIAKHRRQTQKGLTYFFSVGACTQIALHKSPSGHYSYITYSKGIQVHPSQRTTLQRIACLLHGWNESDLQELFNS